MRSAFIRIFGSLILCIAVSKRMLQQGQHARRHNSGLIWFKSSDLRLQDNSVCAKAYAECEKVSHIFIFDPAQYCLTKRGNAKYSAKRLRFLADSLIDLHNSLMKRGSRLYVLLGDSATLVRTLLVASESNHLYFHDEITHEECSLVKSVEAVALESGIEVSTLPGGGTLLEPSGLPFPIDALGHFTEFRKAVEPLCIAESSPESCTARSSIPECCFPAKDIVDWIEARLASNLNGRGISETLLKLVNTREVQRSDFSLGKVFLTEAEMTEETLTAIFIGIVTSAACGASLDPFFYGLTAPKAEIGDCVSTLFKGGETAALERISYYVLNGTGRLSTYKETRNGMLGVDYSSKLSPWLAMGCITSKQVYRAIKRYEAESGISNDSTYWLIFELLWRDYMRFYAMKWGNKLFQLGGPQGPNGERKHAWEKTPELLNAWKSGKTGYPFIDACMRELLSTGYMSNRGRQVVASFLVRDLNQDWRFGAEFFESHLLDYDPCSNYGNWQYSAGVGSDPRDDRYFNVIKQGKVYDPECKFIRMWCPEIAHLPGEALHDSSLITEELRRELSLTEDIYPLPVRPLLHSGYRLPTASKLSKKLRMKITAHGNLPIFSVEESSTEKS